MDGTSARAAPMNAMEPVTRSAKSWEWLPTMLKWVYTIAVVLALGWVLVNSGLTAAAWKEWLQSPAPWIFMCAWVAMACVLGGLWALVLRWRFGLSLRIGQWLPIQAIAWVGRYLPGKIGLFLGKLSVLRGGQLSLSALTQSVLIEQLAFLFTGIGLGCLILQFLPADGIWIQWLPAWAMEQWAWLPVAGAIGCCVLLILGLRLVDFVIAAKGVPLSIVQVAWLILAYALPHVLAGLGFYVLLSAFLPPGTHVSVLYAIAIMAFANVGGVLAVFAPAGLGVREAVLALGLTGVMSFPEALALAAVLRALSVVADVLFALLAGGLPMLRRNRQYTSLTR